MNQIANNLYTKVFHKVNNKASMSTYIEVYNIINLVVIDDICSQIGEQIYEQN